MSDEFRASIEREVLGWPGVSKKADEGGLADFSFPGRIRNELIRAGKAIPHPAFPERRTVASYSLRSAEDLPGAIDLFRINYERAKGIAELRASRQRTA